MHYRQKKVGKYKQSTLYGNTKKHTSLILQFHSSSWISTLAMLQGLMKVCNLHIFTHF